MQDIAPVPPDGRILFFERDREAFGFLSHFWPAPFRLDGEDWPTVEHFYQFQKSFDPDYRAAIRAAPNAAAAKHLSGNRKRSWFRRNDAMPRADWDAVKLDIMRRADFAKFDQNRDLAACLRATGTAEIVEDSPRDAFWGIGPDGTGANHAGRVLMEVRARLAGG